MYYNTINDYINENVKTARAIIGTLPEPQKEIVTDALDWLAWKYEEAEIQAKAVEDAAIKVVGKDAYAKIMKEYIHAHNEQIMKNWGLEYDTTETT